MGFTGWIVRKTDEGAQARLEQLDDELLTHGDTTLRVLHSSINYKDALALQGRPGVVRNHPLVPGIDVVGEVVDGNGQWTPGQVLVVNGAGLGEEFHGGLAERARVDGTHAVAVPGAFSAVQCAAIGTAGVTAALSMLALLDAGVQPDAGPVLVTGAGGGVGSVAIALLAHAGFEVEAATGRPDELGEQLTGLGATRIVDRAELAEPGRPLGKQRWGAVVDSVSGPVLANGLAGLRQDGVATACGLAAGPAFPGNVMPFILRGVSLFGIDSVRISPERRRRSWELLAEHLEPALLDRVTTRVALSDVQPVAEQVLAGHGTGRTVVDVAS